MEGRVWVADVCVRSGRGSVWLACSGVLRQESGLKREQVRSLEGVGWLRGLGFLPGLGVGQDGVWVSGKTTLVGPVYVEGDGWGSQSCRSNPDKGGKEPGSNFGMRGAIREGRWKFTQLPREPLRRSCLGQWDSSEGWRGSWRAPGEKGVGRTFLRICPFWPQPQGAEGPSS